MKLSICKHMVLWSLLLVSLGLQAQTTSATPPNASKHASSENYNEGDIYYIQQLPSGEYTGTMFDVEGNEYPVATFNNEWWTTWNMRSKTYTGGALINGGVPSKPANNADALFAYPSSTKGFRKSDYWDKSQGLLYTNAAAMNKVITGNEGNTAHEVRQGICPTGWHVPSDMEYTAFTNALGGLTVAGTPLKSLTRLAGSTKAITNASSASADMGGFNILLTGTHNFEGKGGYGSIIRLWSSSGGSSGGSTNGWNYSIRSVNGSVERSAIIRWVQLSVRCKKN